MQNFEPKCRIPVALNEETVANTRCLELVRAAAPTVSVGIVTANLLSLGSEIALLEGTGAKLMHFDVMDGCFCPMMTVGPPFIKAVNANDPERGVVRGIALNPGTPLSAIYPLLDEIEMISLLAVNPGWGGQKYIASTTDRIARVQRIIAESGKDIILCVDGGVTRNNITEIAATGADLIVAGSAIFDGRTPEANARFMLDAVAAAGSRQ
jgi:ribulose-phosphate 3-epimerase